MEKTNVTATLEERVAAVLGLPVPLPATLTVEQTATAYGIGRQLAYKGVNDGSIPAIRKGRKWLCPTSRVLADLDGEGR